MSSLPRPLRVLIVDASKGMRRAIRAGVECQGRVRVEAEAGSAAEAKAAFDRTPLDAVILDLDLPDGPGFDLLRELAQDGDTPVVVFSRRSRSRQEDEARALALGARAFLAKPGFGQAEATLKTLENHLASVLGAEWNGGPVPPLSLPRAAGARAPFPEKDQRIILIGASTGGVDALEAVLQGFPADAPATLITQHMPAQFLSSFSARLDTLVRPSVTLARDGDLLEPGRVLIAPGGDYHLRLDENDLGRVRLWDGPKHSGHRPSVDVLFTSAVPAAERVVAVLLTGMGHDGADGMLELHRGGAVTIAQDQQSSVVYGMPRAAYERGGVGQVLPLDQIAAGALRAAARGKALHK